MPELVIELEIAAAPERVWAVLTDFAAYETWNPHQTIKGKAEAHAKVDIKTKKLGREETFPTARAFIWTFEPNAALEFLSGKPFIFSSRQFFHLSPTENGTRLRYGIRMTGLWAAWKFSHGYKVERLRPFYEAFGQALARRVTGRAPPKPTSGNRRSRRASKAKVRQKP